MWLLVSKPSKGSPLSSRIKTKSLQWPCMVLHHPGFLWHHLCSCIFLHPASTSLKLETIKAWAHAFSLPIHTHALNFHSFTLLRAPTPNWYIPLDNSKRSLAQCGPSRTQELQTPLNMAPSRVPCLRESTLLPTHCACQRLGGYLDALKKSPSLSSPRPADFPNLFTSLYLRLALFSVQAATPLYWTTTKASSLGISTPTLFPTHSPHGSQTWRDHGDSPLATTLHVASLYF